MRSSLTVALPDTNDAQAMRGAQNSVFFSPDSDRFVFNDIHDQLHQRSTSGRYPAEELGEAGGGLIGDDGFFYYDTWDSARGMEGYELWRRAQDGSEPESLDAGWLFSGGLIPQSTSAYVVRFPGDDARAEGEPAIIELVNFADGERLHIDRGNNAHYLAPGYLVYYREGVIWASKVDPKTFVPIGPPRPIETDVLIYREGGVLTLSRSGDLLYLQRHRECPQQSRDLGHSRGRMARRCIARGRAVRLSGDLAGRADSLRLDSCLLRRSGSSTSTPRSRLCRPYPDKTPGWCGRVPKVGRCSSCPIAIQTLALPTSALNQ